MKHTVSGSPAFSVLDVLLQEGDSIVAQPKSMVCMSTGISIEAKLGGVTGTGSLTGSLKGLLAGESVALATYRANKFEQFISLAPDTIGPILPISLREDFELLIAKGSFLASEDTVKLATEFTGVRGLIAKKGLFLIRAQAPGTVFLTASGDVRTRVLAESERFVIDNDYVVAFDSTITYKLVTASKGISDSILSGEGLVNRYTGPGTIYYQTRAKSKAGLMSTIFNSIT